MPRGKPISWEELNQLGGAGEEITVPEVRRSMELASALFRATLLGGGVPHRKVTALTTKFRDAGRRSAPWKPTSSRVPGRPQDGLDGNRINRWLLPEDHKFYATEVDANLVEIRYLFQTLSMHGAPSVGDGINLGAWEWLAEGAIGRGDYLDPVQLVLIDFNDFLDNPRLVTSGHYIPLNRGGRHVWRNTFLTLKISNDLQGDNTVDELLNILNHTVESHRRLKSWEPNSTIRRE